MKRMTNQYWSFIDLSLFTKPFKILHGLARVSHYLGLSVENLHNFPPVTEAFDLLINLKQTITKQTKH